MILSTTTQCFVDYFGDNLLLMFIPVLIILSFQILGVLTRVFYLWYKKLRT
jgi:hypothetical protein